MKKIYQTPEAEFVSLTPAEFITADLGTGSNPFPSPFDIAVAEEEALAQAEREAALEQQQ